MASAGDEDSERCAGDGEAVEDVGGEDCVGVGLVLGVVGVREYSVHFGGGVLYLFIYLLTLWV